MVDSQEVASPLRRWPGITQYKFWRRMGQWSEGSSRLWCGLGPWTTHGKTAKLRLWEIVLPATMLHPLRAIPGDRADEVSPRLSEKDLKKRSSTGSYCPPPSAIAPSPAP